MSRPVDTSATTPRAEAEFDLARLLDVFVVYRRMMLRIFFAIAVLGCAAVLLSDPVYEVSILTEVDESAASTTATSLLGADLSSMFNVKSSADTEMQVLQSRYVVSAAVDAQRLYIEAGPARFPVIGHAIARWHKGLSTPGVFGVAALGGYGWGRERIRVARFDVPQDLEGERYELVALDDGAYRLSGPGLARDVQGHVGHPEVFLTDDGPLTLDVADITAHAGTRFKLRRESRLYAIEQLQRRLTISQQGKDSDVVQVKLRGTDPDRITTTLNQMADFYVRQNVARKAEDAAQSLAFLRDQVPQLRAKLQDAEGAYARVRARLGSIDVDGEAKTLLQQSADNESQLQQLQQKRAQALTLYAPGHPAVMAIDSQIAVLSRQAQTFSARTDALPAQERQIVEAARDVQVNSELYVGLLNNIEQLQLMQAGRIGNVRVVDYADEPHLPMRMLRPILLVAVIVFACFAAIASAWLRDLLFGGISDPEEIQAQTELKVFSVVPLCRVRGFGWTHGMRRNALSRRLLAFSDPDDPTVESLRSFRTGLQFSMGAAANNVVMFTGPMPFVGKSFVASNVAAVLARAGKRVLLVDCDLRRAELSRIYGEPSQMGLTDVVAGRARIEDAVRPIERSSLSFLGAGTGSANAADFFAQPAVAARLAELARRFDVVVLDTAPLLAVPDAAILAPLARGNVFLVARAGVTRTGQLEECARRFEQVDAAVTGVVLNGVDPQAGRFRYGTKYSEYRYEGRGAEPGETAPRVGESP